MAREEGGLDIIHMKSSMSKHCLHPLQAQYTGDLSRPDLPFLSVRIYCAP